MEDITGEQMIGKLLQDPKEFAEDGGTEELLQEYFNGLPVETLRPLLQHEDPYVYSAAIAIACEMGNDVEGLLDDILPLLVDSNFYIRMDALESVMHCTYYENFDKFVYIIKGLEDPASTGIRVMWFISEANVNQLGAALNDSIVLSGYERQHKAGISFLLREQEYVTEIAVLQMIQSGDSITSLYGAIAMRRFFRRSPAFLKQVSLSDNEHVRDFAKCVLDEWEAVKDMDKYRGKS